MLVFDGQDFRGSGQRLVYLVYRVYLVGLI